MTLDYLDRIAVAALHTLRSSEALVAWAGGEGRLVRLPHLLPTKGLPRRQIAVAGAAVEPVFQPNRSVEASLALGLRFTWEEPHATLEDDEPSISSVLSEACRTLVGNYYLKRPETGDVRLVQRLHAFRPVDFRATGERGSSVQLSFVLLADYRARLDVTTWEIHT